MKFRSPIGLPIYLGLTSGHTMSVSCDEPTEVPQMFVIAAIAAGCEALDEIPAALRKEATLNAMDREEVEQGQKAAALKVQQDQERRAEAQRLALQNTGRALPPWRKAA